MIQQGTEDTVSPESGSEYQVACRAQALDVLLESASHLFCYVTNGGVLQTVTGISKDYKILQLDQTAEKDSVFVTGIRPVENSTGQFSPPRALQGLSLNAVMPWLWGDFNAFVLGGAGRTDLVKRVNVMGETVEYHIQFGKVVSVDGATAGAILSVMAQSAIGRSAREHQKLDLLEEAFREIRMFCHDFSQPLMVLSGYLELMNCAQLGDKKYLRNSQIEGLEREIHKLGGIYQKLRDAVIRCRKQMESTDTPPAI
ncbi:MAG: hypothetical protein V2B19_16315 [Pseudomonadota bacterium]